jgi:small GTP-binding protein
MDVDGKRIDLQVWDTAGQELYRALVPVYLRGASCCLLLYDITDHVSFDSLSHWYALFKDAVPPTAPLFVVANKIDLADDSEESEREGEAFAHSHNASFVKVSALTGVGVGELFNAIAIEMSKGPAQIIVASEPVQIGEKESNGCFC